MITNGKPVGLIVTTFRFWGFFSSVRAARSHSNSINWDIDESSASKSNIAKLLHVQALEVIDQLRAALKANGGQYVLGKLSYADVVLAITVAGICPPGQPRQLPPARAAVQFHSQELYDACKDLQPWADELLDKHLP